MRKKIFYPRSIISLHFTFILYIYFFIFFFFFEIIQFVANSFVSTHVFIKSIILAWVKFYLFYLYLYKFCTASFKCINLIHCIYYKKYFVTIYNRFIIFLLKFLIWCFVIWNFVSKIINNFLFLTIIFVLKEKWEFLYIIYYIFFLYHLNVSFISNLALKKKKKKIGCKINFIKYVIF